MWAELALVIGAYLLGSAPHLSFLARLRRVDLDGDFHRNLWYRAGRLTGAFGVVGEFVKGILPVLVGRWLGFDLAFIAAAGLAAVCGQMWPVFSRFDGEKGNSIAIAMAFALVPLAALLAIIPMIISIIVRTVPRLKSGYRASGDGRIVGGEHSRSLPVGMAIGFLVLPVAAGCLGEPPVIVWSGAALFVLIMIRRLTAGLLTDVRSGRDIGGILLRRLLYDRATVDWRR
ncbi:MAG: hypothetical protein A2Z05_05530 [Chloroflexi bacterium RBG_16_60_22]|nr:MAG: hypothetical protein A2Z05_05530 [Chloroflexi bacterium RBG_16_60_22]